MTTRLIRGDAALQLSRYVEDAHADLVVITSHGRGPLNRLWLGSVTDTFIRHSTIPALVVRPTEDEALKLEPWPPPQRVLVPLDGSETSEMIFGKLDLLGDPAKLNAHLLRVVTYPRTVASPYMPHTVYENRVTVEEEREWVQDYLDVVAQRLRDRAMASVHAESVTAQSAASGILESAQKADADVIALVTHARKGFNRLVLGSIADKVIRASDRPVLVVPSPKELWYADTTEELPGSAHIQA